MKTGKEKQLAATETISTERLSALGWPGPDPRVGVINVGRNLTAWRNIKGFTIARHSDDVLHLKPNGEVTLAAPKNWHRGIFYAAVRAAFHTLDLGEIHFKTVRGKLTASYEGCTYIANPKGELVFKT